MQRRDFSWDCADCGFNGQLQQGFTIGGMGPDCHFARQQSLGPNVRFGSKADSRHLQPMSALPPKADIAVECAPSGGHLAGLELTRTAGLSEDESHGQAALP